MNVQTPTQQANAALDARQAAMSAGVRQRRADFTDRALQDPEQLGEIVAEFVSYHRNHRELGMALSGAMKHLAPNSDAGRIARLLVGAALASKAAEEIC